VGNVGYIVEFEQKGSDRAVYGGRLIDKMAQRLNHIKGMSVRNLATDIPHPLVYVIDLQYFILPIF